jgi:hypothetical protein
MHRHRLPKAVAAALVIALCTGVAFAATDFVGKYKTTDTQGNEMTITLAEDGSATGKRADESLKGTWKEEGGAALINWGESGWATRLTKEGDKYRTTGFKGKRVPDDQTNTRDAEKVQ